MKTKNPQFEQSETVDQIPMACACELAAVEFLEAKRWGGSPCCVHCGSVDVYKMSDAKTGGRSKRFLWRCKDCKKQYTVRVGTVFEDSRIELRHWCYGFWRASTSKKGVAALEIQRQCQISYKSALFLMHRIRWAMAPDASARKLTGTVECDETYVGPRKPRYPGQSKGHVGRGTKKQPVMAMVERNGQVRTRVIADVSGVTLKSAIREMVHPSATIMSDEWLGYSGIGRDFAGGHKTVNHGTKEYAKPDGTNTNTVEGYFSLVKRSLVGIYHAVSRKHLHRYMSEREFVYNHRHMNDGERITATIQATEGKRLMYKSPVNE